MTASTIGGLRAKESEVVKGMEMGFSSPNSNSEVTYETMEYSPPNKRDKEDQSFDEVPSDKQVKYEAFQSFLVSQVSRYTI